MKNSTFLSTLQQRNVSVTSAATIGSPSFDRRYSALKHLAFMLLFLLAGVGQVWGQTTYEQLTSIANIDENAEYVLGIDGTGFHYSGTSNWGTTALPSAQAPIKYTLKKASNGESFTAEATINNTKYYLQVPTSNTFSMATSTGTNTDLIIGTTQVSGTNYAVANKTTTARHLRIHTSGLRSYAGTTGTMAYFYKVVSASPCTVTWHVNGSTTTVGDPTTSSSSGSKVTKLPTSPISSACDGSKVFVGWTATEIVGTTDTKPADLFTTAAESPALTGNTDFYAVFATETDGGMTTKYKLVNSLTDSKDYIFVTRNSAGNGYAFSSAITTGSSVSIEASGSDFFVTGTHANSIIWTATTGWKLTTKDNTKTNKVLKINGNTFALDATGSNNVSWTTDYGLNGKSSGTTKYYLQCNNGTFSKSTTTGSSTNRVWAYEATDVATKTYSGYATTCCTPLAQINGSLKVVN